MLLATVPFVLQLQAAADLEEIGVHGFQSGEQGCRRQIFTGLGQDTVYSAVSGEISDSSAEQLSTEVFHTTGLCG